MSKLTQRFTRKTEETPNSSNDSDTLIDNLANALAGLFSSHLQSGATEGLGVERSQESDSSLHQADSKSGSNKGKSFYITFRYINANLWVWQNRFSEIEVRHLEHSWRVICRSKSELHNLELAELMYEHDEINEVIGQLLDSQAFPTLIGIENGDNSNLRGLFDRVHINWDKLNKSSKGRRRGFRGKDNLGKKCSWPKHPRCTKSPSDCPVCSSSGIAYSMRSDD